MPGIVDIGINGQNESFVEENIPADGNCLYTSIARLVEAGHLSQQGVRNKIATYIHENWDSFRSSVSDEDFKKAGIKLDKPVVQLLSGTQDEQNYLKNKYRELLNTNRTWGDETSIKAASEAFGVDIVVVEDGSRILKKYSPSSAAPTNTIYLRFVNNNHYQVLIKLKEKIEEMAKIWLAKIRQNTSFELEQLIKMLLKSRNDQRNINEISDKDLQEVISGYLKEQDNESLKQFYLKLSISQGSTQVPRGPAESTEVFSGIINSLVRTLSDPSFINNLTAAFAGFKTIFHKIMVAFNPGIELDESEKIGTYGQCAKIFNLAGEAGRKLYRKLLQKIDKKELSLTKEQFLNVFLHKLKSDKKGLFSKCGHEVISKIEKIIFGEHNIFGKHSDDKSVAEAIDKKIDKEIEKTIEENFRKAFVHKTGNGTRTAEDVNVIRVAKEYVLKLKNGIKELAEQIKDEGTPENKAKLWKIIQNDRLKLVHFMLKTKAFSEGKALSSGKDGKKEFSTNFDKNFKKLAAAIPTIEVKDNNAIDPIVGQEAAGLGSILRLFNNGNLSKGLKSKGDFDTAIKEANKDFDKAMKEANEARSAELKHTIEVLDNVAAITIEKLKNAHAEGASVNNTVQNISKSLTQLQKDLQVSGEELGKTSVDLKYYNTCKQKIENYRQKLANIQQLAAPWIEMYEPRKAAASTVDPVAQAQEILRMANAASASPQSHSTGSAASTAIVPPVLGGEASENPATASVPMAQNVEPDVQAEDGNVIPLSQLRRVSL